ncbi:hypothetical protein R0381_002335 [Jeongeupia wiesaeckerbachi]|uniref:sugar phosphate isomerase/epimerase family protein n=1 Tax=Jeongeupia wiesaeckerbachi TaxID=3051218 RepID=UPI003D803847
MNARASARALGVQLYTLRHALAIDVPAVLAEVARLGYREVEPAAQLPTSPQGLARYLGDCGLTAPAAHIDYNRLPQELGALVDQAGILGHRYLVVPWIDETLRQSADDWRRIADRLNVAGELLRKLGIGLAYHHIISNG